MRFGNATGRAIVLAIGVALVQPFGSLSPNCRAQSFPISVYAHGMEDPDELAFDPFGNLYVGHSRNSEGLSIYCIPPGGGEAQEAGGHVFADPDGLDVDSSGTAWVASGQYDQYQTGEVFKITPDGQVDAVGSNYLTNPTSLELDHRGRFGPIDSLLVAQVSELVSPESSQILSVTPTAEGGVVVDPVFQTSEFLVIRGLSFDTQGTLWFVGGPQFGPGVFELYRWVDQQGAQVARVPLAGVSGDLLGVAFDPFAETLVVGLQDERRVMRVSLDGQVGDELAREIDPAAFAFDTGGNVYVSDQAADVVWRITIPEPSTAVLLGIGAAGLLVHALRKRGRFPGSLES